MITLESVFVLSRLDLFALATVLVLWLSVGLVIENPPAKRLSVTVLMADYRREWMHQMITRVPRIFDATILATLRQGTTFFASSSLIAIGGMIAVLGNTDRLVTLTQDLPLASQPTILWELKLLFVTFFFAHAFLKFVWANRLFGYCAVIMAAVQNEACAQADLRASQAAELNIRAALNFNRGLRSVYFGLAALAWIFGPFPLIGASVLAGWTLISREFASHARNQLLRVAQ